MSQRVWQIPIVMLALAANSTAQVTISVDGSAKRVPVSPTLYGIFFEEVNHSGEGGLYAEMVQNRDFEITTLPEGARWAGNLLRTSEGWQERKWFGNSLHGWNLIAEGGARGSIALVRDSPLNDRNPHSMRFSARQTGRRMGVTNGGFWGMNFQAGKLYDFTFYARTEGNQTFDVTVSLESASGRESLATAALSNVGGDWKQYRCTLESRDRDPKGRLAILIDRPGTIWFDVVSLFPRDTFKKRPNGLRSDIAQMLADLKPAVMRFPGGAIVGGLNLDNRIQWKNSIGDIANRKGTMNLWGYWTSNGLGYHEYLQLCEDIGAIPLWVCNPGFSDNYRHAEYAKPEDLPAFVDEALDALEYALGPADSKWGSQRAANGHPAPFNLSYIEIGNEASGKPYQDSYRLFYTAIRARYPSLTIISNTRDTGNTPVEMVDDHKYGSPEQFFDDFNKYDKADRKGPKIYVGEYGCTRDVGEGNLMAALSEAAYMLGLERNSDVVVMSSYAPLLFHVNDIAWPVSMIGFDSWRIAPRTSYYVQKLFSLNRPDEVLATTVEPAAPKGIEVFALAGFDRKAGEVVIKTVSRAKAPRVVHVKLNGFGTTGGQARVITLAADDPTIENTVDEPDLVVPVESRAKIGGAEFDYTFKANSLTILRIPVAAR